MFLTFEGALLLLILLIILLVKWMGSGPRI